MARLSLRKASPFLPSRLQCAMPHGLSASCVHQVCRTLSRLSRSFHAEQMRTSRAHCLVRGSWLWQAPSVANVCLALQLHTAPPVGAVA